jgi:hypothetical protein
VVKDHLHHDEDPTVDTNWLEEEDEREEEIENETIPLTENEIKLKDEIVNLKGEVQHLTLELKKKETQIKLLSPCNKKQTKKANNKDTIEDILPISRPDNKDSDFSPSTEKFSINCSILTSPETLKRWKEYEDKKEKERNEKENEKNERKDKAEEKKKKRRN